MKALPALLAASLVILGWSLWPAEPSRSSVSGARQAGPTLRRECTKPRALRLHRFEDGSARLLCGAQTLLRISVPG